MRQSLFHYIFQSTVAARGDGSLVNNLYILYLFFKEKVSVWNINVLLHFLSSIYIYSVGSSPQFNNNYKLKINRVLKREIYVILKKIGLLN